MSLLWKIQTEKESEIVDVKGRENMVSLKQYKLFQIVGYSSIITIYVIWTVILILQFTKNLITQDYSIFREYSQISLTLFAITLIGGIFEGKVDEDDDKTILILLFKSSILFLISFICFLFADSFFNSIIEIEGYVFAILFFIIVIGIVIFVSSLLQLWYILTEYYLYQTLKIEEKESKKKKVVENK